MRYLFVISVVAFCALCWASISIAGHIHRARRRRREITSALKPPAAVEAGHPAPPPRPPQSFEDAAVELVELELAERELTAAEPQHTPPTAPS